MGDHHHHHHHHHWKSVTLLLCGFGLLKELRPSEPFVTEYLMEFKNMTTEIIMQEIYPVSTYTILSTSFIIFLVTDFLRYRPIIILEGFALVLTWILLIWGRTLESLIIVEIFYGIAISTDVAYYTYIYNQVPRERYKQVTSYTYSAALIGKFIAGSSAQLLISSNLLNFHQLNYISLSCVALAFCLAWALPSVKQSIYFHRDRRKIISTTSSVEKSEIKAENSVLSASSSTTSPSKPPATLNSRCHKYKSRLKRAGPILWEDFQAAYSSPYILKWSAFWALGTAGNLQILNYTQPLWESIENYRETEIYNGAVATIQCLLSAVASMTVGHLSIDWRTRGEPFLCLTSILQGIALLIMSKTQILWIAYLSYIAFRVLFQLTITIASSEVASGISQSSVGLIFGINTFVALIIQTLLTIVLVDRRGLALNESTQFIIYGCYFLIMGLGLLLAVLISILLRRCRCGASTVP